MLLLVGCVLLNAGTVRASGSETPELNCLSGNGSVTDASGSCSDPVGIITPAVPGESFQLLVPLPGSQTGQSNPLVLTDQPAGKSKPPAHKISVVFFWGTGCRHCEEAKKYLDELKQVYPSLEIRAYEVWYHPENARLLSALLQAYGMRSSGVPVTVVGDRLFSGFTAQTGTELGAVIEECSRNVCTDPLKLLVNVEQRKRADSGKPFPAITSVHVSKALPAASVNIPILGDLDPKNASLPMLTLVLAGMDSFNPCAFFVLLTLLGLLIHAQSRTKMFLIGGVFVFFSGFIYFLFMAAWLNLFLVMGHVALITAGAGCVSVLIAGINIKDYFLFKSGVSLTIPDSAKPKLFERMRILLRSGSLLSTLVAASVLAVIANFYELLCTAGFPMVFTRILTLNNLTTAGYYLYLVLYNIVYVIPLLIIVIVFTCTLGKRQLSEWQGRVLKLVSGTMMLGLGIVLLVRPSLLNSMTFSFMLLISALGVSLLVVLLTRKKTGVKII